MLDGMERLSPLILTTKTGQSFKAMTKAMTKAGLPSTTLPGLEEPVELQLPRSSWNSGHAAFGPITGHSLKTVHRILERVDSPSRRSSTSRTHREQSLQTICKPAPPRH